MEITSVTKHQVRVRYAPAEQIEVEHDSRRFRISRVDLSFQRHSGGKWELIHADATGTMISELGSDLGSGVIEYARREKPDLIADLIREHRPSHGL